MCIQGLTEEQAAAQYGDIDIYSSSFRPMRNTISGSPMRTFMKLVVDAKTDVVVGCHMVGDESAEIMQVGMGCLTLCLMALRERAAAAGSCCVRACWSACYMNPCANPYWLNSVNNRGQQYVVLVLSASHPCCWLHARLRRALLLLLRWASPRHSWTQLWAFILQQLKNLSRYALSAAGSGRSSQQQQQHKYQQQHADSTCWQLC